MPKRPLVLFGAPTVADKEKKHGGTGAFHKPAYDRQLIRLAPKFDALQHVLEQGNLSITNIANSIDPEYTLVFETVGEPAGFFAAINKLKKRYPNIEWVMELSGNCPNDNDFYVLNSSENRDDSKQLSIKLFCVLTNREALGQILSLWKNFKGNEHFHFEKGLTGFKHLFENLKDVHLWGIKERIEDTGLLEDWNWCLQDASCDVVRAQIELFYRSLHTNQVAAEQRICGLIESVGGNIICKSLIPEIRYHALLAEFPRAYVQGVLNNEEVSLISADEIMFMKSSGQTIEVGLAENSDEIIDFSSPIQINDEPIIALFDGMPQENHPLLAGLLSVDDPDTLGTNYPVNHRVHCTSMASLILRGQNMNSIKDSVHKVYIRPIMKSKENLNGKIEEYIPVDFLIVDKIHECIRRLFEPEAGSVAPSVRIINLSIGISYQEFYNLISPLARLLDWLSYKYHILFIVSAGNHYNSINLERTFADFAMLRNEQKDEFVFKYLLNNSRNMRLLSPAESMNALTVGATFSDNNDETPSPNVTNLCSKGIPAIYGSFGRGINGSIKPDVFYDGGRRFISEDFSNQQHAKLVLVSRRKPGIQSAYPGIRGSCCFTCGTSNSAALMTNKAAECYDVINNIFISETGNNIPYDFVAVLIKGMLAHGASWANLSTICSSALNLSGRQARNELHRFLGYGVVNVDRVKECTKNQITLIGYGNILQNQAFEYAIPLPFNFYTQKYKRRLIVTLAYLSPISPSILKYRDKQVWFTIVNGKAIVGDRAEYDYNAVQRGTLQHEVFEADSTVVWDEANSLIIKVNCRSDASEKNNDPVPYALYATFEMAPEYNIDVYQTIIDKIHIRDIITPTATL